jgi:Ca2+-binding RTX toxin-like protein
LDFNGATATLWHADTPPDRLTPVTGPPEIDTLPLEHARDPEDNPLEATSVPATPAFSDDDNRDNFTDAEINDINDIWHRVAEFFSPFDVDVTTVDPKTYGNSKALRVVIGGDGEWRDTSSGISPSDPRPRYGIPRTPYVENGAAAFGSFDDVNKDNTVFVFTEALKAINSDSRKAVAETIGHQVGVAMGLHDAALWVWDDQGKRYVWFNDHDNGSSPPVPLPPVPPSPGYMPLPPISIYAPIMGDPSQGQNAVWWDGDITTNIDTPLSVPPARHHGFENELEILDTVLGFAADDHNESFSTATPLAIGSEQGNIQQTGASGVIESDGVLPDRGADIDAFKFSTVAGTVSFTVTSGINGTGMLAPWLEIRDYYENVLARVETDPVVDTATITATLPEGTYELDVFGPDVPEPGSALIIRPDPQFNKRETRALHSVGEYTITGTIPAGVVDDTFSGADLVFGTTGADKITVTLDPDGKIRNNVNGEITIVDPSVHPINRIVVIADAGTTHEVAGGPDKVVIGTGVPRAHILAGGGYDTVQGGDFNDTIVGGGGSKGNLIYGMGGNDRIVMSGKGGFTFGGVGNDRIYGAASGHDEIHGDDGNDRIYGGASADVIVGGNGNDTIYGGGGNDLIYGQDGNDLIYGDPGSDTAYGGNGNDTFYMRDHFVDSIVGGPGTDSAQIDVDLQPTVPPDTADKTDDIEVFIT